MVSATNNVTEIEVGQQGATRQRYDFGENIHWSRRHPLRMPHKPHMNAAINSCRSATRLVASKTEPIWERSPNFIMVAIRLTASAAPSSIAS